MNHVICIGAYEMSSKASFKVRLTNRDPIPMILQFQVLTPL
jgi:hypothetical protein